jgi:hypothetical protein
MRLAAREHLAVAHPQRYMEHMRINSDESLKRAERTFERFKGDWTDVYKNGEWEDGVFVVGAGKDSDGSGDNWDKDEDFDSTE